MSRSGYSDDLDNWSMIKWRGQVASAIRGARGQKMLREMLAALEALPDKRLIRHELRDQAGEVCALGALGVARGMDVDYLDPEDPEEVASAFDIAPQLAREIVFKNDECYYSGEQPEQRYSRMVLWVKEQIRDLSGPEVKALLEPSKI